MPEPERTIAFCHSCGAKMDVSDVAPFTNVGCPACGKHTRVKREFGPYTLVRRHAIGGMSMVFAAHDNTLDREVALKILSEEFSADERRIAAFEEEARITASFSHPHVVRVLTTGRAFDRFYIAMELVPGGHFEHQIRKRGKIPEVEMLPLAIEIAQGLKAAHSAGLIHRDVKPGNILLDAEGRAKLVDFGLALVTQGGKAQATELWATPYYVPPETVEGHAEDFRSDVYAFGATLYHALSGKPSCGEESMATDLLREAKKQVKPLSTVDHSITSETCGIVEKAMAYDPDARYGAYDEMIAALASSLSHLKSGRSETSGTAAKRRAEKKRKERGTVIRGMMIVAVAAVVAAWWINRPPEEIPVVINQVVDEAPPPAVTSTENFGKVLRNAHLAMEKMDYQEAESKFQRLHLDPNVQEPTRSWAGIEATLAAFLDGRPTDARTQAKAAADHLKSLPQDRRDLDPVLSLTLEKIAEFPPIPAPGNGGVSNGASHMLASMLAGLKNWEQGLLGPAAVCFRQVASANLPPKDQWAAPYQKLAGDYLADYTELTRPVFHEKPADKAACAEAVNELNTVLATLKTRGRARYNVRAWQLDLTRRGKLLETDAKSPSGDESPDPTAAPPLDDVLAKLAAFSEECRFFDAVAYLMPLPADLGGATRSSLRTVSESAAIFLSDIESDLAKGPITAELPMKSGQIMEKITISSDGAITVAAVDGHTLTCKWSDFSPDALIGLHRILVKNTNSEVEQLRRHECAIAFDWLAGNRRRALDAAAFLANGNPTFEKRWKRVSAGLPK